MKIYTDELPMRCRDCPCYDELNIDCKASEEKSIDLCVTDDFNRLYQRHKDCPLQVIEQQEEDSLTCNKEVTYDYDEFEDGESVEQVVIDGTKYIDISYFAKIAQKAKWFDEFVEVCEIDLGRVYEYSENPIIEHLEQIADFRWCDEQEMKQLKQQLTEKDVEIDDLKRDYIPKLEFGLQRANKMGKNLDVENEQLKQQLAEKEEEIEDLRASHQKAMGTALNDFLELRTEFSNEKDKIIEQHKQDKIELLKKVRNSMISNIELAESSVQAKDQVNIIIDTLISEIKGEKS